MITLYEHQQRMLNRLDSGIKRFGLYWDTGLGKTHAALSLIHKLNKRAIIVTRPSVLESWTESGLEWGLKIAAISNSLGREYYNKIPWIVKGKLDDMRKQAIQADVIICSHETFPRHVNNKHKYEVLILDECHKAAGHTTQIAKVAYKFSKSCEYCFTLSATPLPNSVLDAWTQNELLHPGCWGPRAKWLAAYGSPVQVVRDNPHIVKWFPHKWAEKAIKSAMAGHCEYLDGSLCPDMPELSPLKTSYAYLTASERKIYNQYNDYYRQLSVDNLSKRLQIATGQVYTEQGIETIHTAKLPVLMECIQRVYGKVIVWVQFNHEKVAIMKYLEHLGCVLQDDYKWFIESPDIKVLIAHPASLGTGTDGLQTVCSGMVWYSVGASYVDYYQACGRLKRIGAQSKIISNQRIMVSNSFDRLAWQAVEAKKNLLDYMREVEE